MRKLGQNRLDRIFEQGLQSAEAPVSAGVWAGISAQLENSRLRRKLAVYRMVAAASVVLLMGFGAWSLAFQPSGAGNAAATLAMGKALNGNAEAWSNRDCPTGSPADFDDVQGTNLLALRRKQAAYTPIWIAGGQYSAIQAIGKQRSDGKALKADQNTGFIPEKMEQSLAFIAHILPGRVPNLLPNLAEHDRRSARKIVIQEQGLFAGLLPMKSTEKRKEKEFAFVLDEEEPSKKRSRWELGAGFSPDMTFASITPIQQNARSTQILADDPTEANTKRLSPVMAYATGLRATFALNDRFSLRSGLSYINRQTSTNQTVNSFGKIDAYQSNLNLSSMEIPVTLRYNLITNEHFDYFVATGVSGTFLLSYENTQVATDGKISARRGSDLSDVMRPSQGSALASTGLRYRIHNNLSLQLEPGLRYGLLTNEYAFSQSKPLSMSLTTGLNYRF